MSLAVSAARPPQAAETTGRDLDLPAVGFDSIPDALEAIRAGQAVVVLDDEDRENEGDLILAADRISEAAMAFMVEHTSGVVCIGMEGPVLDRLRLPLMVSSAENEESMYTAFTITADLREGTTTGISAADRAATLRALADPSRQPEDFRRPGHVFPLRYRQVGNAVWGLWGQLVAGMASPSWPLVFRSTPPLRPPPHPPAVPLALLTPLPCCAGRRAAAARAHRSVCGSGAAGGLPPCRRAL